MSDPYYDDEYYDYDYYDDDPEPECTYFAQDLMKSANGHLVIVETSAWLYPGDFSDCDYWESRFIRLGEINEKDKLSTLIEAGKGLKPGESMSLDDVFTIDEYDNLPGMTNEFPF